MQDLFIEITQRFGYIGVAFLIFIENIFPPIPSEIILLFGGYAANQSILNIWGVIGSATIGSVLGATILYYVGYILGKERLKRLLSGRVGRFLHFGPENIEKADVWFKKYRHKAVLICRCIPIIRSIISIPAGLSKMKFGSFIILTFIGSAIWNTIIVWLGFLAGDAWEQVDKALGIYSDIILVVIIIALVTAWIIKTIKEKKK